MSEPPLVSRELFEQVRSSARGKRWFELLTLKAKRDGAEAPEAAAAAELTRRLSGVLERLASRYKHVKIGALEQIGRLQVKLGTFYADAIAVGKPDLGHLERLLHDLDAALDDLRKGLEDVAAEAEHVEPEPTHTPSVRDNDVEPGSRPDRGYTGEWPPPKPEPDKRDGGGDGRLAVPPLCTKSLRGGRSRIQHPYARGLRALCQRGSNAGCASRSRRRTCPTSCSTWAGRRSRLRKHRDDAARNPNGPGHGEDRGQHG